MTCSFDLSPSALNEYSFSVYRSGKLLSCIRYAFLAIGIITDEDLEFGFRTEQGKNWLLLLDSDKEARLLEKFGQFNALLSFRETHAGECICIARAVNIKGKEND